MNFQLHGIARRDLPRVLALAEVFAQQHAAAQLRASSPGQPDDKAYFQSFCEVHGPPITDEADPNRRLLFRDGWIWADGRSYEAAEIKPHEDARELHRILRLYWQGFLKMVATETDHLSGLVDGVAQLQAGRSLPLRLKNWPQEEITNRLTWLAEQASEARRQLESLKENPT